MKRKKFLCIAGSSVLLVSGAAYILSDTSNITRSDSKPGPLGSILLNEDEREILYLASLAPSGHNTQPWFVKYLAPYHWIICNDKSKWLSAVDPTQRETILSIGAFVQNLEYAAIHVGYNCQFTSIAVTNQEERIMDVKLTKSTMAINYDVADIKNRRTVRSNYSNQLLTNDDIAYLLKDEKDYLHYLPNTEKEYHYLNEQTIAANRIQSYRDDAEKELSEWIRFSAKDARKFNDGLTPASMEITGIPGWVVRNFYNQASVMKNDFREKSIGNVIQQVSQSAGWLLITSKDNLTSTLLETGKRMQRIFLKVRQRGVAMHPMTQALEEPAISQTINQYLGVTDNIQFIIRMGYIKNYPDPVSLRRPVERFVRM